MTKRVIFLLVISSVSVFTGCGGSTGTAKTDSGQKTAANSTAANNSAVASNSAVSANPNDAPVSAETMTPRDKRFNRAKHPVVDADPSATPLPLQFRPAADDSQIAVTMKPNGSVFEVRIFKSNPKLARVEATWLGEKEKELKFYLRNGTVLDVKTDKIVNLQSTSLKDLLEIAKVKP